MQIVVNGLLTEYVSRGSGDVVVMLHGWGDNHKTFKSLFELLSQAYRVVALDLPGFGGTQGPQQSWGLDDYCEFVAAFLKKLQLEPVYGLIGHSNGAAIVIRGLGEQTLSCDKLILLGAAGIRDEYKGRKKVLRLVAKGAKLATKPLPKKTQQKLKKKAYSAVGSDLFVAEHMQETFKRVITDDVQADAKKIIVPTLLIYGSEDTATPVSYGERYHKLMAQSELLVVPAAGHFVHHDASDKTLKVVEEFLHG